MITHLFLAVETYIRREVRGFFFSSAKRNNGARWSERKRERERKDGEGEWRKKITSLYGVAKEDSKVISQRN